MDINFFTSTRIDYAMREMLEKYEGKECLFEGQFGNLVPGRTVNIYAEDCYFYEESTNIKHGMGHMVWHNIINYNEYANLEKNDDIIIKGIVNRYPNNNSNNCLIDDSLSPDDPLHRYSVGLINCTISSVIKHKIDFSQFFIK